MEVERGCEVEHSEVGGVGSCYRAQLQPACICRSCLGSMLTMMLEMRAGFGRTHILGGFSMNWRPVHDRFLDRGKAAPSCDMCEVLSETQEE